MKILIVGAGIGGLALGAHLTKSGHQVTILEKFPKPQTAGFAIGLWGAGLKTLEDFEVMGRLEELGHFPSRFNLRLPNGKVLKRFNFSDIVHTHGRAITLLRSDFHELLLSLNNPATIRWGTSVRRLDRNFESVTAYLTDGRQETYDLVVGADGIHSTVRELVWGHIPLHYSGLTSWIWMTNKPQRMRPNITEIWAGSHYFGLFPYRENKLCAIFAMKCRQGELDKTDSYQLLQREFAAYGWVLPDILAQIQPGPVYHTDWNELYVDDWVKGRVVLIGDAAHAMLPTAGSGASMALQDAYWLSKELQANPENLEAALKKFVARQRSVVRTFYKYTNFVGRLIRSTGLVGRVRNILIRIVPTWLVARGIRRLMALQDIEAQPDVYAFVTEWKIEAPSATIEKVFKDFLRWPSWWRFIKSVSLTKSQNGNDAFMCTVGWWRYQFCFTFVPSYRRHEIVGMVSGDFYGKAVARFAENDDGTTAVTFHWKVLVETPGVRRASTYCRPFFIAAHNMVMRSAARGLARASGARLKARPRSWQEK